MLHYQHHASNSQEAEDNYDNDERDERDEAKVYLFNSERRSGGGTQKLIALSSNSDRKAASKGGEGCANTSAVVSTGTRHHLSPKFCYDLNSAGTAAVSHSAKQKQAKKSSDGTAGRLIAGPQNNAVVD